PVDTPDRSRLVYPTIRKRAGGPPNRRPAPGPETCTNHARNRPTCTKRASHSGPGGVYTQGFSQSARRRSEPSEADGPSPQQGNECQAHAQHDEATPPPRTSGEANPTPRSATATAAKPSA